MNWRRSRVDTLGEYAYKYTDDGGQSWSEGALFIPIRATDIDRSNPYEGSVRFFWGVGKPLRPRRRDDAGIREDRQVRS